MDLPTWIKHNGTVSHRSALRAAGFSAAHIRQQLALGTVVDIGRMWVAVVGAEPELTLAARHGGKLTCVSLASRKGWWVSPDSIQALHLTAPSNSDRQPIEGVVRHYSRNLVNQDRTQLSDGIESTLRHIAHCLPLPEAIATWESAIRVDRLSLTALQRVRWRSSRAREVAHAVTNFADSGLDSRLLHGLAHLNVKLRPQFVIDNHPFDLLIGDLLLIEVDGFEFHSSSSVRSRDVRRDATLALRGYTTLRFTYAQVVHEWAYVRRTIEQAIAQGLHLAPARRTSTAARRRAV